VHNVADGARAPSDDGGRAVVLLPARLGSGDPGCIGRVSGATIAPALGDALEEPPDGISLGRDEEIPRGVSSAEIDSGNAYVSPAAAFSMSCDRVRRTESIV
jgi:hypothetical protein